MAIRYYVSTEEASFFNNNRMGYANNIPTEGNYKVGDFIISSTQENGVFGWVCTVAGNPGEWEVIGSGAAGGNKVVGYVNAVSFSNTRNSIEIGIDEYEKGKDFLEVHYNGLLLAEGVHYNVNADGKSITAIDAVWNENADDTQQMIFRVLKSEGVNVKELKNTVEINSACYEVEMGITGFNPGKDIIEVHLNGVMLIQGVDYEVVGGKITKLDRSEAWNPYNVNGQKMFIRVLRNNASVIEPIDGSVTINKLSDDIKEDLAAIDGLIASVDIQNNTISNINDRVGAIESGGGMSGKQDKTDNNLVTTDKTIVGAINELFQSANNGKELIASAIGEPLNAEDTFSAMSSDINGLLSSFNTNMMNSGVTVESGYKFKQLIEKIKGLTEGEGNKGMQFAEGACNVLYIHGGNYRAATIETNLDFTPNMIFATISVGGSYIYMGGNNVVINNLESTTFNVSEGQITLSISNVSAESFSVVGTKTHEYSGSSLQGYVTKWYAIGVGEEDTTLRDSLADILGDKGVEVNPDDDMASLISKVEQRLEEGEVFKEGTTNCIDLSMLPYRHHNYDGTISTQIITRLFTFLNKGTVIFKFNITGWSNTVYARVYLEQYNVNHELVYRSDLFSAQGSDRTNACSVTMTVSKGDYVFIVPHSSSEGGYISDMKMYYD